MIWVTVVVLLAGCAPHPEATPTAAPTRLIRRPAVTPTAGEVIETVGQTPTPAGKGVTRVKPKTLLQGDHWPVRSRPLFALITGPQAWETFLTRQRATTLAWPPIDWEHEVVFVALMGGRNTGGYRITVDEVLVQGNLLIVRVKERTPQPGEMVIQVLTSPFHVVALPREPLPTEDVTLRVIVGKRVLEAEIPSLNGDKMFVVEEIDNLERGGNDR